MKRALVVGAGLSGAVAARQLAGQGYAVRLLERRAAVGGNCAEHRRPGGIWVQTYGPHLFHTGDQSVFDYLAAHGRWGPYRHKVLGFIDGAFVPIPFNFTSLETLLPDRAEPIKAALLSAYPADARPPVLELAAHADPVIRQFGAFVLDKVFLHYTAKQWGIPVAQVDPAVLGRVPVVLGYADTYFVDPIQQMPLDGFNALFQSLLAHEAIAVETQTPADGHLALDAAAGRLLVDGAAFDGPVVYTGCVDELFGYRFGRLPYRAIRFAFEDLEVDSFQPAAVVNYPNTERFTRITEYKKITGQQLAGYTSILREYPTAQAEDCEPCYPIESPDNRALYEQYRRCAAAFPNLYLCGRLAEYRYFNMDQAVASALQTAETIAGAG